jgi:hypothetical protein
MTATNLTLSENVAGGGAGNKGGAFAGDGIGGGLANEFDGFGLAMAAISNCTITQNQAVGGPGGVGQAGSDGLGGGVANLTGATLTIGNSMLDYNLASGREGAHGGQGGNGLGGGVFNDSDTAFGAASLTVAAGTITQNQANGGEGEGGHDGQGVGGGIYNLGMFTFDSFTVIGKNHASTANDDLFT